MMRWGAGAHLFEILSVPTTAVGSQDVMLHIGPAVTNAGWQKLMNTVQEGRDGAIEGNVPSEHYQLRSS